MPAGWRSPPCSSSPPARPYRRRLRRPPPTRRSPAFRRGSTPRSTIPPVLKPTAPVTSHTGPGQDLAWAGVRPGMKVVDLIPGQGYFTRILSKAVGPTGKVFAYVPDELTAIAKGRPPSVAAFAGKPPYANTRMILRRLSDFGAPEKVDVVFTAQNYHDMHAAFMGPADLAVVNRQVFKALKPGGVYIVIDHAAKGGSGLRDTDSLHRIDPAIVRKEIEAAGFVFEGQSNLLRNARDPLTANVFDAGIRGNTDQFAYKFRKPRNAR